MKTARPIDIPKSVVWEAFKRVKENRGAAGIDNQSIKDFEADLSKNLYKIWNRMSSGSYFPPAVKQVPIPKKDGGVRNLSVPSVSDRIAQTVVKLYIEPRLDPIFHSDSYGYRPKKSAIEAIAMTRKRCWRYDWVVEFDIRKAFDSLDRELVIKALEKHISQRWIIMYVKRWLTATIITPEGVSYTPIRGVPQGSVIGPLLMNLFMHYAFDKWMQRQFPQCSFARYADDSVVHCRTQAQAETVLNAIAQRLIECGLEMHPDKSKLVYCSDDKRKGSYSDNQFTFLGYSFRPRLAKSHKGTGVFVGFQPAVSPDALKAMRGKIRAYKVHRRTDLSLEQIAFDWDPIIRGWWNYYGKFYRSEFYKLLNYFHKKIMQWVRRKYAKLKHRKIESREWLIRATKKKPRLLFSATLTSIALAG